jgi:hypothetical protein
MCIHQPHRNLAPAIAPTVVPCPLFCVLTTQAFSSTISTSSPKAAPPPDASFRSTRSTKVQAGPWIGPPGLLAVLQQGRGKRPKNMAAAA